VDIVVDSAATVVLEGLVVVLSVFESDSFNPDHVVAADTYFAKVIFD